MVKFRTEFGHELILHSPLYCFKIHTGQSGPLYLDVIYKKKSWAFSFKPRKSQNSKTNSSNQINQSINQSMDRTIHIIQINQSINQTHTTNLSPRSKISRSISFARILMSAAFDGILRFTNVSRNCNASVRRAFGSNPATKQDWFSQLKRMQKHYWYSTYSSALCWWPSLGPTAHPALRVEHSRAIPSLQSAVIGRLWPRPANSTWPTDPRWPHNAAARPLAGAPRGRKLVVLMNDRSVMIYYENRVSFWENIYSKETLCVNLEQIKQMHEERQRKYPASK